MYDRIELVWPGKTDAVYTQVHQFRVVETIGEPSDNKIILGDNKLILSSLKDKINLIYIDPPFNTNKDRLMKIGASFEVLEIIE